MSVVEDAPKGIVFVCIGIITIIIFACIFGNSNSSKKQKSVEELYEEKVSSGSYTATVKGTQEYRKDINGNIYVRNDTTTIIE